MKFCDNCDNMLYVTVEEEELRFVCKNCNFVKKHEKLLNNASVPVLEQNYMPKDTKSIHENGSIDECIMNINYADDSRSYKQFITTDIKYDPTLPHVNNIPCTNPKCTMTNKQNPDTIFIKYDHINMKYMYFCCHCEHFWKL